MSAGLRARIREAVPATMVSLLRAIQRAPEVQRLSDSIRANIAKDELFAKIFVALEQETVSLADLQELLADIDSPLPSPRRRFLC